MEYCEIEIMNSLHPYANEINAEEDLCNEVALFSVFCPPRNYPNLTDVERYAKLPCLATKQKEHFNILQWWKARRLEYPLLSQFFRDFISVSASSAPSERVFSVLKKIVRPERSRMSSEHFKQMAFISCNKDKIKF